MSVGQVDNDGEHFVGLPAKRYCSVHETCKRKMEGFLASHEALWIIAGNIRWIYVVHRMNMFRSIHCVKSPILPGEITRVMSCTMAEASAGI
ncbi:hypothetical protein U8Q05_18735 [Rhizobium ruizarguesonis]|nr:hypothetical protein U8Q05_18735 [Rhizobium ruizarguesonis]